MVICYSPHLNQAADLQKRDTPHQAQACGIMLFLQICSLMCVQADLYLLFLLHSVLLLTKVG